MGLRAGGLPGEAKVQRRCDTWDLLGNCGQVTICPDVSVPGQPSSSWLPEGQREDLAQHLMGRAG